MAGKYTVLRTVYITAVMDDALRDEAFATGKSKNELMNYYLELGMKVAPPMKVKKPTAKKYLWEILVPTVRPDVPNKYFTTRYHKVWDEKVRVITGGLTIMTPAKGQWVAPNGELFAERMIPVRILCTRAQIDQIVDMTLDYYSQQAVLCYKISSETILKSRV